MDHHSHNRVLHTRCDRVDLLEWGYLGKLRRKLLDWCDLYVASALGA